MLTLGVWIASEEVMDKVIMSPVLARVESELLEAMCTVSSVGGVVSTVNPLIDKGALSFPAESITLIVQFVQDPSLKEFIVIILLPAVAKVLELLQDPP